MSLYEALTKISRQVQGQLPNMLNNEAATINVSIEPFVRTLGYDKSNLNEVYPQYPANAKPKGMEAVDIAILRDGKPIIFIEAKSAGTNLNEKHWEQLYHYFNAADVSLGILTNGVEYRFYSDMDKIHIMDSEPFFVIDLLQLDKRKVDILEGFTKARFDPVSSIRFLKIRAKVERILNNPDEWFIKHVIYDIHEGTKWKQVVDGYKPLVKKAIDEYVDKEIERRLGMPESKTVEKPDPSQDGLEDENPSIKVPIYMNYKKGWYAGLSYTANLLVSDDIGFGQEVVEIDGILKTPSGALGYALQKNLGEGEAVKWVGNGWWFWKLKDPADEKERPIDHVVKDIELRNRLLAMH